MSDYKLLPIGANGALDSNNVDAQSKVGTDKRKLTCRILSSIVVILFLFVLALLGVKFLLHGPATNGSVLVNREDQDGIDTFIRLSGAIFVGVTLVIFIFGALFFTIIFILNVYSNSGS